ncbi:thioredoxin family protein [Leptolyngbya sp. GGD]|uniref:thioredoxin family protein n=1 Tax=Leptolyngbya sp. GGD TaxID=2997907 RepID=UPI00227B6419|nr:thioredoxin domain-containing protein [Leptolyngbya sp. GGD]MCY6494436.1 thioredoxin domain-containing protein [Leptolyngbya sp. GGD]
MFANSISEYAPVASQSIELQPQEMHFFSFKVTAAEKQGMGYRLRSEQQYLCHLTDQRFIFVPMSATQKGFQVHHDTIERLKLVRTLNLATFAELIFKTAPAEVAETEWIVAVSSTRSSRSAAKDFVQFGNELLGVVLGGFQVMADDPQAISKFKQEIAASELPVVVDFVAEKCEPCVAMAPIVNELAEQFSGKFKVIKVDIEKNPAIMMHYGINCFPTLLIVNAGHVIDQIAGVVPKPVLVKVLNNHLARL